MNPSHPPAPVLAIEHATLGFGGRTLWTGLDLTVGAGEMIAVLGPNGSGKTMLLRAILGQQRLDAGVIRVLGRPVHGGDPRIGYIPQQRIFPAGTPMRGRDLVSFGANGQRFGLPISRAAERARVDALIEAVGATGYARRPIGLLSGGEQQRLRAAQALAGEPGLLLADEPLLSLDLEHQAVIAGLLDRRRREHGTAVVVVTHDVGPFQGMVDRVVSFGEESHLHAHHETSSRESLEKPESAS